MLSQMARPSFYGRVAFHCGEGSGTPLQCSLLENPTVEGAWWAAVHGVHGVHVDSTEQLHFHFSLSCIGEGNGNPLQCSCRENPRDGGAWWAAVYGVAQSRRRLKRLSSSSIPLCMYTTSSLLIHHQWTLRFCFCFFPYLCYCK